MSLESVARFSNLPVVDIQRSKFKRPHSLKTTFNAGELVPIFLELDVLPGDTFELDMSSLVRMSTPIFPVMDNAYLDVFFFFVPNRLLWDHWQEFNGENSSGYWAQTTEYTIPQLKVDTYFLKHSLGDYFCLPTNTGQGEFSVSHLPFRAYTLIWNEFFRDQNTMPPAYFVTDDNTYLRSDYPTVPDVGQSYFDFAIENALFGTCLLPVAKYHDYFTSCLPAPQKGSPVELLNLPDKLPVYTGENDNPKYSHHTEPINFHTEGHASTSVYPMWLFNLEYGQETDKDQFKSFGYPGDAEAGMLPFYPSNLYADAGVAHNITINSLRQAFQIQRLLEKDARGGTRYRELLKMHFGVDNADSRMQIPEYLGGKRIPINVDQVLQTSSTDAVSPQGNTAGYSLTTDVNSVFTKSFTEHGMILGLACVRTDHTYQQGIDRGWSRKSRFDFYWPSLAHISEQPVYVKELWTVGNVMDEDVFGYQEAWADYRYKPSHVSGAFRSVASGSLDSWHYADYYTGSHVDFALSAEWLCETKVNIDRTLAVTSAVEDQFIADFFYDLDCVRPMPLYSVPGLIDHY